MRCATHIINLIVRDGLVEVVGNVSATRNAVGYIRSCASKLRSLELRVDSGKLIRGSLPLDVKTKWNSTYLILSRALEFRLAFDKMEPEDMLYNEYFMEFEAREKWVGPPAMVIGMTLRG